MTGIRIMAYTYSITEMPSFLELEDEKQVHSNRMERGKFLVKDTRENLYSVFINCPGTIHVYQSR